MIPISFLQFEDLGKKVGADAGAKAAEEAVKGIDLDAILKEAGDAAREAAESNALLAKVLLDTARDEAINVGKDIGAKAGKVAGELSG